LAVSCAAVAAFGLGCSPKPKANAAATAPSGAAPAWQLKAPDGKLVRSTDFAGKVVVVDFWATWCPPCVAEIPGYVQLQEKYRDAGLVIVGISLDEGGTELVKKFAASKKINYPLAMGDPTVVEAFGGVEAIPTTFIIDREGKIRHKKTGAVSTDAFETLLKQFL
jgi:peroxiredoxin